jgi:hypothetical protein
MYLWKYEIKVIFSAIISELEIQKFLLPLTLNDISTKEGLFCILERYMVIEGFVCSLCCIRSHTDTPNSVGRFSPYDQHVTLTFTLKHTTLTQEDIDASCGN